MRFLFDHGIGRAAERALRAAGHDVRSIVEVDPRAADDDILGLAVTQERIVVTTDLDFGELAIRHSIPHRGIVILRMDDADSHQKAAVVSMIVSTMGDTLYRQLTVFQNGRLRTGHYWAGA
jgi:predicted nuclease of predicted toxin-antitoxin system